MLTQNPTHRWTPILSFQKPFHQDSAYWLAVDGFGNVFYSDAEAFFSHVGPGKISIDHDDLILYLCIYIYIYCIYI